MADTRRQTSNPTTPVTGGPDSIPAVGGMDWVVGMKVRLTTVIDDVYEGTIFAYDPTTHTVAIAQGGEYPSESANGTLGDSTTNNTPIHGTQDFRIIKISFLKEVTVLARAPPVSSPPPPPAPQPGISAPQQPSQQTGPYTNLQPSIAPLTISQLLDREKAAVKQEAERHATRGVGVTQEAQDLFDALNRTMQCRWQGRTIVVVDVGVAVDEPYESTSCRSLLGAAGQGDRASAERAVERVRKVLEGEKKRLEDKKKVQQSQPSTPTPGGGGRKGG